MRADERAALKKELEAMFSKYGIDSSRLDIADISVDDFRRIREIALQVLRGNISSQEISKLTPKLRENLDVVVEQLLRLKDKPGLKGLEERNPYYSPFGSNIVRDN